MRLLFVVISFIAGLYFLRNNIVFSIVISILFLGFCLYRFRRSKLSLFFMIIFFAGGIGLSQLKITYNPVDETYSGMVISAKDNYFIFESNFEKFYVYEKDNDREVGDFLTIKSSANEIVMNSFESQFDFKQYLNDKGVYRELSSKDIKTTLSTFLRLKKVRQSFLSNFDDETATLIDAFLFNNKDYSNDTISKAGQLNLVFLLSLSGVYLHFLMYLIEKLINLKFDEKYAKLIPILLCVSYAIFTFPKIGVIRVLMISLLRYLKNYLNCSKKHIPIQPITHSIIILLLIDYHLAFNNAFIVGYALTLVLVVLNQSLPRIKRLKRRIVTPILIYLFFLPVSTFSSGEIHLLTFLFQLILIPVNALFVLLVVISFLKIPIYGLINGYSKAITFLIDAFNRIDITLSFGDFGIWFCFIHYLLFAYGIYLFESKRIDHLKKLSIPMISLFLFAMLPVKNITNAVYFVNVGQGDSIVIRNHNKVVMIDTGGNKSFDMAKETLIPFLHKKQINHIDALITTHGDFDHDGAAESLMKNFKVYNYITNQNRDAFPYKVGDLTLYNLNNTKGKDDNDNSLVIKTHFIGKNWLFMGDAGVDVEKALIDDNIDIKSDILKLGHHGSKTSSSLEFLKTVNPDEAIVSVGAKNYYGHPSKEVIERLNALNIKIRQTSIEGTISYLSFIS